MIDGLKPYSDYRNSGDRWLQQFPSAWERVRIKYLLREIDRRTQTGEEPLLSMRRDHGLVPLSQFSDKVAEPTELLAYKLVRPGELVVNRMQAGNGLVFVARIPGLISPDYAIFRPVRVVNLDYLELLFRSYPMRAKFRSESTGLGTGTAGFLRLYGDSLGAIEIGLPSAEEQSRIVRFIDHADRRIRLYVRTKKKLIGLLNEQKQTAINRAVTTGVDRAASLKPSGVEWLGDIPQHWQVKRLKWAVRLQRGYDLPSERRLPGPYPVVSSGGEIGFHSDFRSRGPGVAMGRYGSTDAVFYIEGDFWPHNTALFVTDFQGNQPRWCYFLLRTISKADHSGKSAVPGVDRKDLYEIEVAVPPASEQDAIVTWIDAATATADRAIARMEQEVALLQDYRSRLIADVVTGKIDVREAAAHLPDAPATLEDDELLAEEVAKSDAAELDDAEAEVPA
jgi:type I restriction enzyme S subunit